MKRIVYSLICALSLVVADPGDEVLGVLIRLLGNEKASVFNVTIDPNLSSNGKDMFSLFKDDGDPQVYILGSSGVAAAWGAHQYLTQYCGAHISWDGDQLNLPSPLPSVNQTVASLDRYKYYQNVCTSSYSSVWWDWKRWEREIDWMALKGVNLALAFVGQEAIWRRVYDGLGVLNDSFTGPAFLAWARMGNMKAFGGGLSPSWHLQSIQLQHLILDRMRSLGITPVLPAFNGIVAPDFLRVYPGANVTAISRWNNLPDEFCCPYLLDPADPLFSTVSRVFLREYIAEFGTNHIYNSDTFNENDPGSDDPSYLAATARAIYEGMIDVDPTAVWMVQGWMFLSPFWGPAQVRAYVTSVPLGSMLILDLQSDLTPFYEDYDSYYGQPFIWCTLHNFGGQLGLYGHLDKVNKGIVRGRTFPNSTMVGIGITPEGIDQNYIMYEFTLNGTVQESERNLTEWVQTYVRNRYAFQNSDVEKAWQILKDSVYNYNLEKKTKIKGHFIPGAAPYGNHIAQNILTKFPTLSLSEINWYNKRDVLDAFLLMLGAAESDPLVKNSTLFGHDLVDTARQVVQLGVGLAYNSAVSSYRNGDLEALQNSSAAMLNLMTNLEVVLNSDRKFLLGHWLEDAKSAATSDAERTQYEWNARNQITLWGPTGEIRDYAAKQWAGMMADFYVPRWQFFLKALEDDLSGVTPYNRTVVDNLILNTIEIPFTQSQKTYPIEPTGDSIQVVQLFNQTLGSLLDQIFSSQYIPRPVVVGYADFSGRRNKHL